MLTLGINAAFHDPAACIVRDGRILAAAEEERFTRIKHGKRPLPFSTWELPFHAIDFCLSQAGAGLADVDHVAYSFDPTSRLGARRSNALIALPLEPSAHPVPEEWESGWDPLFLASIVNAPRHLSGGAPHHLAARFRGVSPQGPYRWHFVPHHLAHAASAFLPSPFESAAILTLDGRGERASTTFGLGSGSAVELLQQVLMPHSLGLLYEDVTRRLGFQHSSDECKVMALASSGRPIYLDFFRSLVRIREDGFYTIAQVPESEWEAGIGPERRRGGELAQRHFDIARSLQQVLEESVLSLARALADRTGSPNLCLAGGVALNCVMNARLRDESPFQRIWVQPAAGDAGTALGAAMWIDALERGEPRDVSVSEMTHAYWGPEYPSEEIEELLRWSRLPFRRMRDIAAESAALLAQDRIIGWFQGRMEFGPRALGARSILASPISSGMQERLNDLKEREDFRPVAPVVLEEEAGEWFSGAGDRPSPFMLFVHPVRPDKAGRIPAVRHVDGTARIQTVRREQNALYHDLLRAFKRLTGVPVLVNTSFNTRSEPIVRTPRDAIESFWSSPLDALVIGPYLVEKPGLVPAYSLRG